MYIVKYRYTDVSARTRASQIGKLLRCSDEIEIQSRIYADIRIRTYVIVSKQGLRSSEIVSPEICIYRDFNIFKLNESHKDALTPSKSEITEIFHDQLRFVHRGVHEIFKTVET